ncbi:dentin sialophosphoprotein [Halyomorpha halys]|uniref:dentin sialophosphoprotein n=1 Tax=Halyomorpha halys TaxID=286706 RepID=UPI0006D500F0|nr:uncharacterized protein LOC106681828 [Halyomorpha halys]
MRLSTVFELLLIFLFLAFAASRTIHPKKGVKGSVKQTQNRYCQCSNLICNCCRDFSLPVVSIKGPGCATLAYLNEDAMRLTMTFGDKVLRNITLAGKRPNPVCMPLPGGVSKFCGRVYGITRDGEHFKACLALELRSLEDLEAALRVSCFRFGPEGVKLEPGRPVPVVPTDEDEDDDDDDYGFSDDDDDDDDDDFGLSDDDDDDDDDDEDETENDVDSGDADYTAFSALSDEFLGGFFGSSSNKKPVKPLSKPSAIPSISQPQSISKDKPTKTTVSKVTISTAKPIIKKTTTTATTTTKAPKRATTTANMEVTQTKILLEEMTSTQNYAETSVKNHTDHSHTDAPTNESSTQMIGYTAIPADDDEKYSDEESDEEEYGSTESSSEESTETYESIDSENKDNNSIASKILDDEEEGEERTFPSNRGHNLTPAETEQLFPGLTALIRPPSHISFSFPPVRSARTHRRMRLPPIQN